MFQHLPPDIVCNIFEYDSTFRDIFAKALSEIKTTGALANLFENALEDIVEQPSLLRDYTKENFEVYAEMVGFHTTTSRKLTRRRLLRKLICYHLQERHMYELSHPSLWVLG